jgi:TP901 family phage tail tape measure protein
MSKKIAFEIEIKNVKQISTLKKELKELRKEQRDIEKQTNKGSKSQQISSKRYAENSKKITEKSRRLRELNKQMKGTTKSSNGMAKQFIKAAAAIGIVVGAFRAVSRIVSSVVSVFTEFEFVMAKVNAVSGATNEEFKGLTATAEELGRTTFYTAAQVGELMLNFSKLGFTAKEIQDAVQPTLDLATATGSDLARAATVAGAAVRGFGLDASETGRVVDVMAVSFSSSAMNIEKWQTSMTKVAPIAKSAGFSIEDTAAIMSKLTDSGIEASIAGTSLRNILLKMQDPTSELSMRFGKTIHSLDELVPAMKKFVAEGGSMADVMEVVDLRQAAAFEQMMTTADGTLALRDALLDANGEGARMAAIVGDTLQGAFLKLKSALQGLSISVMEDFSAGLQSAVEISAKFFNTLAENSKAISGTIKFITKLAKWFGIYKITLIAVSKWQKFFTVDLIATRTAMAATTVASWSLTGALTSLKLAFQRLMGATGIGLLVVGLTELASRFLISKDKVDDLSGSIDGSSVSVKKMTDEYHKSLKPIEQLKIQSQELIRLKGLMNKMVDREGKLLENTAVNQKIYTKHQGQAAILLRKLNGELKKNDQALLDEKTSIEGVKNAIDKLTESLMNQALVKGFEKQLERVTEVAANAEVTRQKLIAAFDLDLSNNLGVEEWHKALEASHNHFIENGQKGSEAYIKFMKIMKEGGFTTVEQMMEAIQGSDEQVEIVTKAFDKLAGGDGIGALILSLKNSTKEFGDNTQGVTDWAEEMKTQINNVKNLFLDGTISEEEYRDMILETRAMVIQAELDSLENTKTNEKKITELKGKALDIQLQQRERSYQKEFNALKDKHKEESDAIEAQYTINGKLTADGHVKLQELEILFLNGKKDLHDDYKKYLFGINEDIAESNRKLHEKQMAAAREQISALSGVGSAMQTLAGENESLNKVRQAGEAITRAAAIAEAALTLKTNLQTIAKGKDALATLFSTKAKTAEVAVTNASTISETANTTATAVNTGVTTANTAVTGASLGVDATKSVLSSGKMLPWPINLIAFAATIILIKKIMGMFEKGGIIDGKFAAGGMVQGKSHAQGGEKFAVGGRLVELEGGEAVINKRSTAMFRNQLSAMNQAGGGVKFADGGLLNNPSFTQQQFNSLGGQQTGAQKVYVVETDITQTQNTVSVLEAQSTI